MRTAVATNAAGQSAEDGEVDQKPLTLPLSRRERGLKAKADPGSLRRLEPDIASGQGEGLSEG